MAKFTKDFNKEIYRTVKSFNQRIKRAEARGLTNLPERQSVAELKARYSTVKDLKKELGLLRRLNRNQDALHIVTTKGGARLTKWEYDYMKKNLEPLKKFYDVMLKVGKNRFKNYPYNTALKEDVLNLERRRDYLNRNLTALTRSELLTFRRYLSKYKQYDKRTNNYYDLYLKDLDGVIRNSGFPKVAKDVKKKLSNISPQVFAEVVKNHDFMHDIFTIINSPQNGAEQDNTTYSEDVEKKLKLTNRFLDGWIKEAENNLENMNLEGLTDEEKEIYNHYMKA